MHKKQKTFLIYRCYADWLASTTFSPNACSTFFGALRNAQEEQDTYECANFCHTCIIQKYRFDSAVGFHIFNLLVIRFTISVIMASSNNNSNDFKGVSA
jgi:hypothetical protein